MGFAAGCDTRTSGARCASATRRTLGSATGDTARLGVERSIHTHRTAEAVTRSTKLCLALSFMTVAICPPGELRTISGPCTTRIHGIIDTSSCGNMVSDRTAQGHALTIRITDAARRVAGTITIRNAHSIHRTALRRRIGFAGKVTNSPGEVVAGGAFGNFAHAVATCTGGCIARSIAVRTRFAAMIVHIATGIALIKTYIIRTI